MTRRAFEKHFRKHLQIYSFNVEDVREKMQNRNTQRQIKPLPQDLVEIPADLSNVMRIGIHSHDLSSPR